MPSHTVQTPDMSRVMRPCSVKLTRLSEDRIRIIIQRLRTELSSSFTNINSQEKKGISKLHYPTPLQDDVPLSSAVTTKAASIHRRCSVVLQRLSRTQLRSFSTFVPPASSVLTPDSPVRRCAKILRRYIPDGPEPVAGPSTSIDNSYTLQ